MSRATPFELVFGAMRDRFDRMRQALVAAGKDPVDRDAFLLEREVAALLHELRPEEGYGEGTEAAAALLHHAYLFWAGGEVVRRVPARFLAAVIADRSGRRTAAHSRGPSYVQLPALAIWGVLADSPLEPLDGWFVRRAGDRLDVLAVFGIREGRGGFTTIEASGGFPGIVQRNETTPLFEPVRSETGSPAGVGAVTSEAELLELCWRIEAAG